MRPRPADKLTRKLKELRLSPRRILVWSGRLAAGLVGILLLGAVGLFFWLRTGLPEFAGQATQIGLTAPVRILRDGDGVPHIFAATAEDAYQALGFAHAQDRLFQMDFQRRLAAGRLAELVGSAALPLDRTMRTLGLYRLAEDDVAHLGTAERRALEAYSRGVNGFLERRTGALPPEYLLLNTEPEPWRLADSLVWGRVMALLLSGNWRAEAVNARLLMRLPPAQAADLLNPTPDDGVITLPRDRQAAAIADPAPVPASVRASLSDPAIQAALAGVLAGMPDAVRPRLASNAWAIDGRFTRSGKPLLANDPHLGFQAPALWYLARIETPELSLAGATAPGVPFHVLGHNGHLAWGLTTTGAATQDLVLEKLVAGNPDRYLSGDGSLPIQTRQERIQVRGAAAETLTVRQTRHGPVISDLDPNLLPGGTDQIVALRSTALLPEDDTVSALYRLNRARDWPAADAALSHWGAPIQNVMLATTAGDIGLITPGRLPIRPPGSGLLPLAGWTGEADWRGFVPYDAMPHRHEPAQGYLVNANNRLVDTDYPYPVAASWDQPYRAQRITTMIKSGKDLDVAALSAMQMDDLSLGAVELLPRLLAADPGGDPVAMTAHRLLRDWDRHMDRERAEPLIYAAWERALYAALFEPALGPLFTDTNSLTPKLLARALGPDSVWCQTTAECDARIRAALGAAITLLTTQQGGQPAQWRWGRAHQALHGHPLFGRLPVVRRLGDIQLPQSGGNDTVQRGAMRLLNATNPFQSVHGAGYRAVYDLGDLAASRFMIATGQSGHPLSGHYADMTIRWRDGETRGLAGSAADLARAGARLFTLAPP